MAWRDRRERDRHDPWEHHRQRQRSPVVIWEQDRDRNKFDRYDSRDRDRDRFDRRDHERRHDRETRPIRDRDSYERDSRDRRDDRNEPFDRRDDRSETFDRRGDREERRDYDRRERYDSRPNREPEKPKTPPPPVFTEVELEQMKESKELGESSLPSAGDWYCVCGTLNFKRRPTCYRRGCNHDRTEGTVYAGDPKLNSAIVEEGKAGITKRLLFRRMDTLTNEEKILDTLKQLVPDVVEKIVRINVAKDSLTGISRGMAYISFNSIADSTAAHAALMKLSPPLTIDNREVLISYCYDHVKTTNQYTNDYSSYYNMQAGTDFNTTGTVALTEADRINAAAAVAQSAINAAAQARMMWMPQSAPTFVSSSSQIVPTAEPPDGKGTQKYSPPDVRTFLYDETSGYYYDHKTGLYYDGTTQYFYNNKSNTYMYWDATNSTYYQATQTSQNTEQPKLPEPPQASAENTIKKEEEVPQNPPAEEKKKEREDKVKVAKKIAKDMARWAKTLNQKKENARNGLVMEQVLDTSASKGSADIGFSVLGAGPSYPQSIVREISPGPPVEEEFLVKKIEPAEPTNSDEGIIDWSKLTCLLCKRKFPSAEVLTKHKTMSDLHKQNLAEFHKNNAIEQIKSYRDRAAERRMKYGELDEPIRTNYPAPPPVVPSQPTNSMVMDTIGGKMLQKMGWSEGKGLGKSEQGRTAPIEAEKRVALAGLGQKRGIYTAAPGETYRDTVKKLMIARYKDLVGDE